MQQPVEPLTITVDGVGAVIVSVAAARDEAIRDALRRAVEQAVGVSIEGRTLMVDLQVVEDRVVGRADGFVRSYWVIHESRDADVYRVTVEAAVDSSLIADDLEGFGALLRLSLGNPRVLVIATGEGGPGEAAVAQRLLLDYLVERQFLVVSAEQLEVLNAQGAALEPSELTILARTVDADLIITADVEADYSGTVVTTANRIMSQRATVSLQAVLASTGQVIASRTSSSTRASTSIAASRSDAIASAVAVALPEFTLDAISVLNDSLSGAGGIQSFSVVVEGVGDFGTVLRLREALSLIRGIESVQQRVFDGADVSFDLQGSATTEEVAIQLTSFDDLPLAVTYLDSQRLELEMSGDRSSP